MANTKNINHYQFSQNQTPNIIHPEMILEIKKINLKKPIYLNDSLNKVENNVMILPNSDLPNIENGNLNLAAHSGSSIVAYFDKLDQLIKGDIINITYQNKTYDYSITQIFTIDKSPNVTYYKIKDFTTLMLITCDKTDKNKRLLIYASQI